MEIVDGVTPTELTTSPVVIQLGDSAVRWGGTEAEGEALLDAVENHRECLGENCNEMPDVSDVEDCAAHRMLYEQRVLDGLLMVRRDRQRWIDAEWGRRRHGE